MPFRLLNTWWNMILCPCCSIDLIDEILNPRIQQLIRDHLHDDPFQLLLTLEGKGEIPASWIVQQIQGFQKAWRKVPEWAGVDGIVWPESSIVEQGSSEYTAKYKAGLLSGDLLIDLTGGLGVDTYYFSKHFKHVLYIDKNGRSCAFATHNFKKLGANNIDVVHDTAEHFIDSNPVAADVFYIDPARRLEGIGRLKSMEDFSPAVTQLIPRLKNRAFTVMIKLSPMLDISFLKNQLPGLDQLHVVAVDNECKELICCVQEGPSKGLKVRAVDLSSKGKVDAFVFDLEDERVAEPAYSMPMKYLYEPNAAVMKAGAFRLIAQRFGIRKLQEHSHLYTDDRLMTGFPGRVFEVVNIVRPTKADVRLFVPEGRANLTLRNFRGTVRNLRTKLSLKEGGDDYIFGTTLLDGRQQLLICRKVNIQADVVSS